MSPLDPQQPEARRRRSPVPMLAAFAAAIAAVIVVGLLLTGGDDDQTAEVGMPAEVGVPIETSVEQLRDFAREQGNPVFWAGEIDGTKLEFTETSRGHVFVRYLPEATPIGDDMPKYTTVATYPQPDAVSSVRGTGGRRGNVIRELPGGGLAGWSRSRPSSVYVGFPGIDFLVEVFHPNPTTARDLALSGRIKPVG